MLTRSADINKLETAAAAEIPADPATVLWVSIRSEQAFEVVMGPRVSFVVPQTCKLLLLLHFPIADSSLFALAST
jgi:hypothetical protein